MKKKINKIKKKKDEEGNDKKNGKKIYNNGDKYEGDLKNDKREGKGKMIYNNGNIFNGEWKDDKEYDIWIEGIWKDGKRIKEKND